MQRIEIVIVDAPVDHVNLAFALGGAHIHRVVAAEKIRTLDQFNTHLPGQQRVLEVGGVERTGRQHHHGRIALIGRRSIAQCPQQMRRIVVDRPHPVGAEQVGEYAGHHPAVLHDVGHTRRRAQVVLEHPESALRVPDEVDTGDVYAHAVGRADASRLPVEVLAGGDQPTGDDAVAEDFLIAVDVVEEALQGDHSLGDPSLQARPLGRRNHPGHQIQREGTLLSGQGKGDALIDERPAQCVRPRAQFLGAGRSQLGVNALVGPTSIAPAVEHFVEGGPIRTQVAVAAEDSVGNGRPPCGLAGTDRLTRWGHASHAA